MDGHNHGFDATELESGFCHALRHPLNEVPAFVRHDFLHSLRERPVIDRVFDRVRPSCVGEVDGEIDVDHETLADLFLLGQHTVVGKDLDAPKANYVGHTPFLRIRA